MRRHFKWALPLIFFVVLAPFTPFLDMRIAALFYVPVSGDKGHFIENTMTHLFYTFGEMPAFILGTIAGCIFLGSWLLPSLKKWRKGAFTLGFVLVLGSGIIVNLGLKEHWQRPRPKQIEEFGGRYPFRPFYVPKIVFHHSGDGQKSFPSGHATMGFYFFSLTLVGYRYKNRLLFYKGLFLTLILGVGLMVIRMMQGGHFFSDTLTSALIMWEVTLLADFLILKKGFLFPKEKGSESHDTSLTLPDQ
jgi:lipid A 4'-phosphatase